MDRCSQVAICLLDGGTSRSFIQEDISRALNFPVIGKETLNIFVFGSKTPQRVTCKKVKVHLKNIRNNQNIEVQLQPKVSSSVITIASEKIRNDLESKGMPLADVPVRGMESEEMGVLIGGDQYWKIVTGKMEKLEDGLVALKTVFGWLVQGEVTTLNIVAEAADVELLHASNQLRSF